MSSDSDMKNVMQDLKKLENRKDSGGIITVPTSDSEIDQVIISYILEQKEQGTSENNINLIVGTPKWIKSWNLKFNGFIRAGILKDDDLLISYFYNRTKSRSSNELAKNDIVITTYDTLKTKSNLPIFKAVDWERIILYEANKISDINTLRFGAICELKSKYRWCLTENFKQHSLAFFLKMYDVDSFKNTKSLEEHKLLVKDIEKDLEQVNLYWSSTELKMKRINFVLKPRQKEFTNSLAQCEAESTYRTTAYGMNEDEIRKSIIAFLLDQDEKSERSSRAMGKTLLVMSPDVIKPWKELLESLLKEDYLAINYYGNETKKSNNSHVVVITTYDRFEKSYKKYIQWERIIFYGFSLANAKCNQHYQKLLQLSVMHRWCLTEENTHRFSAHFLKGNNDKIGEDVVVNNIEQKLHLLSTTKYYFTLMTSAIKASKANDCCQFSNDMWESIVSYTKEFFYKNFEIWLKEDESLEEMYEMMCLGLDGSAAALIIRLWVDVNWNHTACKHDSFFITRDEMDDIVDRWKKSIDLTENAHIDLIRNVLIEKKLLQDLLPTYTPSYIIYDFDVLLTKAKKMSEQDPPDIVIFSYLIWGAAVVCLRKFFLDRLKLEISGQNAQEILMEIVVDSFTDDTGGRLLRAWTFAKLCRKKAYAMSHSNLLLRNYILESVKSMEECINKADIEKIWKQLEASDLQILKLSKNYFVTIGKDKFLYNKVTC